MKRVRRNAYLCGILIMALMLSMMPGCYVNQSAGDAEETVSDDIASEPEPVIETVDTKGSVEKAAYFLDTVYKSGSAENTMVSPLSLEMALGLVSGGAQGSTKDELNAYLEKDDYGKFASEYMTFTEELNWDSSDMVEGGYRTLFEIANSVWVRQNRELVSDYANKAKNDFSAEIESIDFDNKPEAVKRINGWCDEKTHGLIPSIVTEDAITETLTMLLINSLYFEAPWSESWMVSEGSFTDINGNENAQDMLKNTLSVYYENDYATAFAKSYMNGLEFIGILPKETGDFDLRDLDIESLLKSRTFDYDVNASMPKLDFETTAANIIDILKAQGVVTAFNKNDADFSGLVKMDANENAYISDIIQKCKLELDENGTKAAAVTAISMDMMSAMPIEREVKEVHLNRPFAFMIYDSLNEQIVFIGKVVKP